jgi:hypothetical protein
MLLLAPAALFSATLAQKNSPVRPADADSPVLIWDVDPKLAKSLPRNFRTTDDPIKANKGQIPSDTGLADFHASGSGEFTAEFRITGAIIHSRGQVVAGTNASMFSR